MTKAAAAQFISHEGEDDRQRKISVYSSGKTPTPSNVPTRKPSEVLQHAAQTVDKQPNIGHCKAERSDLTKDSLLSSPIIRDYLALVR
ncbi:hypothetical protein Ciccas_009336 [Cichlidogyrus casuarinus]|uniref:Uncharacterized protein n=1 Tax=Cichlidogyrus casuarinus TaxID=1844966 RepID=A0ABD2PYR8_9PLAT